MVSSRSRPRSLTSHPLSPFLSPLLTQNQAAKTVAKKALAAVAKPFKTAGKGTARATRKAAAALRSAAAKRRGAAGVPPALPPLVPPPAPATPVLRDDVKAGPTPTERTMAFVMLWLAKQPSPPRHTPAGVAAATLTLLAQRESTAQPAPEAAPKRRREATTLDAGIEDGVTVPSASRPAKRARVEHVRVVAPPPLPQACRPGGCRCAPHAQARQVCGRLRPPGRAGGRLPGRVAAGGQRGRRVHPLLRRRHVTVVRVPVMQEAVVPASPSVFPETPAVMLPEAPRRPAAAPRPAAFDLLAALADAAAVVAAADATPVPKRSTQVSPIFSFAVDARASKAVAPPPPRVADGCVTRSKRGV